MEFGEGPPLWFKIATLLLILSLLRVAPASSAVTAAFQQARVAASIDNHAAAAVALRRVVENEPWRDAIWEQIGREEYAAGRVEEALAAFQTADSRGALSADGQYLSGEAYVIQHDYPAAVTTWKNLLHTGGPSARVFEQLARLQREQGDFLGAIETLRAWHAYDAQDARVMYLLGLHLCVTRPEQALTLLLEAAQKDGRYTEPVQWLRRGLSLAGTSDQPSYGWLMIGRSLGSIAQWDLAAEAFHKAVEIAPDFAEGWAFLGEARVHIGGTGKPELERAYKLDRNSPVVNALYALSLRREGAYAEALKYLETVAAKEPQEPAWQIEIGNTVADLGDLSTAQMYFERAVELAPNNAQYRVYLARFSNQYNVDIRGMGLAAARQAVLLAPDDPSALDAMGWTMANLGDNASAERFLQQALEKDTTFALAALHLAQVYLNQQDAAKAYPYLKRAESLGINSPVADTARRLLKRYFGEGG